MALHFEWDKRKAELNLRAHGVSCARLAPCSLTRCRSQSPIQIIRRRKCHGLSPVGARKLTARLALRASSSMTRQPLCARLGLLEN